MSLPVVELRGDAYEQGVTHGRVLKDRIAHNLGVYFDRFAREVNVTREEVLDIARPWATFIETSSPNYHAGMRGVADGSGFAFDEIAALNVRYEILYYKFGTEATAKAEAVDGCTAFAVLPSLTENGHLIMGQNWDWIPEVQGAVLHTIDEDGFETLAYTEAGIVGAKIGCNTVGVGLSINGMTTVGDDWAKMQKPFHVRCYEILRSRTFEDAVNVVTGERRALAGNFLVAQTPDKVTDIEAAPEVENLITCRDGCVTHANHFIDPKGLGIVEPPNDRRVYSWRRESRLRELLLASAPLTVEKIQDALRDTLDDPFGICRHRDWNEAPEHHYTTVTSVVIDLDARTLYLTDGPPDESPYQKVSL